MARLCSTSTTLNGMASKTLRAMCDVLVASLVWGAASGCAKPLSQADAPKAIPVELMQVAPVQLQETTELSGVLDAIRAVDVVAEVSGKVQTVHRDVGHIVRTGDVLASLDTQVIRQTLNQADAALLAAEAREGLAREDLGRDSTLVGNGDIAQAVFDASRMSYTAALADLKAARAARELAARSLREADMRAPFTGSVARRYVDVGTFITPGMPAFRVVDIDSLRLVVNVAQHHVGRLSRGSEVSIIIEALPGLRLAGRIRSIAPEADVMTRTFPVEVVLANPPGEPLRSGLVARATVVLGARGASIAVPREAVIRRTGGQYVFVVSDSTAEQRLVTVGPLIGDRYVIEEGLQHGDRLVVVGVQNLHDGAPVIVEPGSASSTAGEAGL